jgi:hypothetical protein
LTEFDGRGNISASVELCSMDGSVADVDSMIVSRRVDLIRVVHSSALKCP